MLRPGFVSIVTDSKDDVVGFAITIPCLSKALQKANGSLFPLGFLHLVRALRKNDAVSLCLTGVRPDYQGKGLLAVIIQALLNTYNKAGVTLGRTHPQLEDNLKAVSIWKNFQSRIHIRRRCWIRDI